MISLQAVGSKSGKTSQKVTMLDCGGVRVKESSPKQEDLQKQYFKILEISEICERMTANK